MDGGGRGGVPEEPSFGARRYIKQLAIESLRTQRPIALDSSALIPYFEERSRQYQLLKCLFRPGLPGIVISYISVAEVLALPAQDGDIVRLQAIQRGILSLRGLKAIPLDEVSSVQTAIVRARTGLKLPDSAIIAAAHLANACALIGNDRIWKNRDLGVPYHHLDDILTLA